VKLQYRLPVSNAEARGRAIQHGAALEQSRIQQESLRAEIATGVRLAVEALGRGVLTATEADSAVAMYGLMVENERTKHRLDAATLFDVIMAEDALTGALLARVSARLAYARALADLRFETGTLVTVVDGRATVRAADLLAVPGGAER
jgi:outer membrane protein TolC